MLHQSPSFFHFMGLLEKIVQNNVLPSSLGPHPMENPGSAIVNENVLENEI